MIVVVLSLLVVLSVPLLGGDLTRARDITLTRLWLPLLAIVLQTLAVDQLAHMTTLAWALHAVSYALAVWFLWLNREVPGLWLVGVGGIANLVAIAANGGVMPATEAALAFSGRDTVEGFANSAASEGSALWFLGDVFAIPAGWPFANVFSAGDVVLVVGLWLMLLRTCRRTGSPVDAAAAAPLV